MSSDYLDIALRAYAKPRDADTGKAPGERRRSYRRPDYLLVLDTETTTDPSQQLLFGSYRFYQARWQSGRPILTCLEESLFYADDLPDSDPVGFRTLSDYAHTHTPAVAAGNPDAAFTIDLYPLGELRERLYKAAYKARALVVCFNLPFDLSRLAVGWGEARSGRFAGGFSLALWEYEKDGLRRENRYRPRLAIKSLDSKRALKGFTGPRDADPDDLIADGDRTGGGRFFRGHLLDLRTLAFALTDRGHTLESACEAFGAPYRKRDVQHGRITPEYIDYNREDVEATANLYSALMDEYARHPIDLQPTKAYSPASVGKEYLRAMGIKPILKRQPEFPKDVVGHAMTAYYGGRAECRIRKVPVPVAYCDFLSMYPTVNALMGLWSFVSADRIEVVEDTDQVQAILDRLTLEVCLRPKTWKQFPCLVQVEPNGEVLPVRARYAEGATWGIGVNPLTSSQPLWYALPDVIASKLLTGRTPTIRRALCFAPAGRQKGLREVRLHGEIPVEPATHDLFQVVVEQRQRLPAKENRDTEQERLHGSLKVLANATSYGIYAETVREEVGGGRKTDVTVHGLDAEPFLASVSAPETPGEFAFPPLAACITAAARLMLALLERLVTDAGGSYVFCDTDSMAIVSQEHSGLIPCPGGPHTTPDGSEVIRALSWTEVDRIVARFEQLNPYDGTAAPGSILELECENFDKATGERRQLQCYAISAKRYALYNLDKRGEPILRKSSQHGLGHLRNPADPAEDTRDEGRDRPWITQCWHYIVRLDALGLDAQRPPFLDRIAMSRLSASSPALLRPFADYNRGKPYTDQIKPDGFLLSPHVAPLGHPEGADPERFHLFAPYEPDARKWEELTYTDRYSGRRYRVTTEWPGPPDAAVVKTYRWILDAYRVHPEEKSLGTDGRPCRRDTRGLLRRRPVKVASITYIGKESNRLDERTSGLLHDEHEALTEYRDPRLDPWRALVLPVLRELRASHIAEATGLRRQTVTAAIDGSSKSRAGTRARLTALAGAHARDQLRARGLRTPKPPSAGAPTPDRDLAVLAAYLDASRRRQPERSCQGCEKPLSGRQGRWCSDSCRKRAHRSDLRSNLAVRRPGDS